MFGQARPTRMNRFRSYFRSSLLALALVAPIAGAHATVFKCTGEDGRVTYTNDGNAAPNCTALGGDLPVSSIPPPPRPSTPPAPQHVPASASSPAAQETRGDNTARHLRLQRELDDEQAALAEARRELASEVARDAPEDRNIVRRGDDGRTYRSINEKKREERLRPYRDRVEMHENNIEALRREQSRLR